VQEEYEHPLKTKLFSGKRQLLKCLLDIHRLFSQSNPRYLLNRLFIEDYCVWIQEADDKCFAAMADEIGMVSFPVSGNITLSKV
jgi:protein SHQ1